MTLRRRTLLRRGIVSGLALPWVMTGCAARSPATRRQQAARQAARVVVIGGGYGGAACARYLRRFGGPLLDITLVTPRRHYDACPFSNAALAGIVPDSFLRHDYRALAAACNIKIAQGTTRRIDPARRQARLADGATLAYDRLVLSPGISLRWNHFFAGYDPIAAERMPHAWQGGAQIRLLRKQLRAMPDGGVFVMAIPGPPFRCPPGPYERAALIAWYLQRRKPRAKILLLDANERFSKQDLFEEAWQERYPRMIERIPISDGGLVSEVDARALRLRAEAGWFQADVANVIPFQQAGEAALNNGLTDDSGWCPVDHQTFESRLAPGVHVIGDSCLAGAMPKSASSANSQAKACALAIANLLADRPPGEMFYHNTCYSLAAPDYGISINSMFRFEERRIKLIQAAGGLSPLRAPARVRRAEAKHARAWYRSINLDTFGLDAFGEGGGRRR